MPASESAEVSVVVKLPSLTESESPETRLSAFEDWLPASSVSTKSAETASPLSCRDSSAWPRRLATESVTARLSSVCCCVRPRVVASADVTAV